MADDAVRELSGKLGLDTTDFKTALLAANRELRVLESGFRASAAGLGDWAKDATGLELRIKSLTGQLDLQRAKVAALAQEYERVAAEKGKNSRAALDLQIKLNKETETLGKMEVELRQSETALDGMGEEAGEAGKETGKLAREEDKAARSTKTFGDRVGDLAKKLNESSQKIRAFAVDIAKAAAKIAVGLAGAIAGAVAGIGALVLKVAAASDEIVENAEMMGITAEQYQVFKFIGDQVGTSVETVGRAFGRTTKAMAEAQKRGSPMNKLFKNLGVSITDANGNLRDSEAVFQDLIGAIGSIGDETQREIIAQQLFGKSYQELIPLINAGADGIAEMTKQAREMGIVIDEEAVNAAADLNDELGVLKGGLAGLGARIAGAFIPLLSSLIDKFQEWLASPAVQKGIDILVRAFGLLADAIGSLLSGNLDQAITQFGAFAANIAKLFGASDKDANTFGLKVIRTIKGIIKGVKDMAAGIGEGLAPIVEFLRDKLIPAVSEFLTGQLIPFIQQHGPEIKAALAAIGIALGVVGVIIPVVAGVIAALTSPITLIIAAVGLLAAAWAGNWGGIRDKVAAVWAFLEPIFQAIGDWLGPRLSFILQGWANLWTNVLVPALRAAWEFIQTNLIPILQTIRGWLAENLPVAIRALSDFWNNTLLPALTATWEWINTNLVPLFESLWELLQVAGELASTALAGLWQNVLQPALEDVWAFIQENLIPIFEDIWAFVDEDLMPVLKELANFLKDTLVKAWGGITEAIQDVIRWIDDLIETFQNVTLPDWLTPGSPTPFEMGLRGIARAARDLANHELRQLADQFGELNQAGLGLGGVSFGPQASEGTAQAGGQMVFNVTVASNLDVEKLAYRVAEVNRRRMR